MGHKEKYKLPKQPSTVLTGISVGIIYTTLTIIAQKIVPSMQPLWPDYAPLNSFMPLVTSPILYIFSYIRTTIFCIITCLIINRATNYWKTYKPFFSIYFLFFALNMVDLQTLDTLPLWLAVGVIMGCILLMLYRYVIRYDSALIPLATGSFFIAHSIQQGIFNAYPGAHSAALINIGIITCLSGVWFKNMNK